MRRYDSYKDSGVAWVGEIPEHWDIHKVKEHFTERKEKVSDKDFPPLSVSKMGVVPQLDDACKTDNGDNRKLVCKGDYVVNSRSDRKGSCGVSSLTGSVSLINIVLCPRNINSLYIHYMFRSNGYIEEFYRNGRGIVADLWTTRYTEMRNIYIPVPPLDEQHNIVEFLDEKTAKIDTYIQEKEKEIRSLEELKQAEIVFAVTHGINPNVPMKDSGVAWIGEIPEHWDIHKVKEHFTERKEKVSDKDFPPLSVSKMGVVPQLDDACKTDNGDNRKLVCKGDYVVNSRSDRKGSCGVSSLTGSVSLINIVLCPRNINSLYIHYMFRSNGYIEEFYRNGRGIVADLWTTRYTEMRNIYIPVPPLDEQQQIVEYIQQKTAQIDKYISDVKRQIDSLKEYRQRLICDAVTGRINVQPKL
ncbi:restriction endonuclease subunit S [Phocaeicola plebeius]|uniref:restriction endonuclease subunit S n=1 Tax=Phocaeicola plebeius TaxID=310297 RepID=UPI003077C42B